MKNKKVIARGQLPTNPPIIGTIVILLVLDRFKAPEWLWSAVIVILFLYWILIIFVISKEDAVKLKSLELKRDEKEDDE